MCVIGKHIFYSMIQRLWISKFAIFWWNLGMLWMPNQGSWYGSQRWSPKNRKNGIITRDNKIVESMFETLLDTIIEEHSENREHLWYPWNNETVMNFVNELIEQYESISAKNRSTYDRKVKCVLNVVEYFWLLDHW